MTIDQLEIKVKQQTETDKNTCRSVRIILIIEKKGKSFARHQF